MEYLMSNLLLTSIEYGGYISPIKIIIFLVLFFAWLALVNWIYKDAGTVGTKVSFWTAAIFSAGAAAAIIWLIIPVFIIGLLFYLIVVCTASAAYVTHRNAQVPDFDRILSADHIKGLFTNKSKKTDALKELLFITANNNEVPIPEPGTPDFFSYKITYDIITNAILRRVSDVVFTPDHQNYRVIYYVDGAALKQPSISKEKLEQFIHFVKNLADLDLNEKRKPQKGNFRTYKDEESIDWEVSTAGSTSGEVIKVKQLTQQCITYLSDINLT